MKLNINKACDLSSISVLPPHSRRPSTLTSGMDSSGSGRLQLSQQRSQSQQPFSQGPSLSQLSQSSLDDAMICDQRYCSQERESSGKRFACPPPITSSRDESQLQLSKTSNNFLRRSSSAYATDQRCQVSDELELRIGSVENSMNRLARILDAIQNDVMQVNKTMKEVLLEVEGIRQKATVHDSNIQLMVKGEEEIKTSLNNLTGIIKSTADQSTKQSELSSDQHKFHAISSAISSIPARIEARLQRLQSEICGTFTKELQSRCIVASTNQTEKSTLTPMNRMMTPGMPRVQSTGNPAPKEKSTLTKSTVRIFKEPKQEEVSCAAQVNGGRVNIESDEEMDGAFTCLLQKKNTGGNSYSSPEARAESLRILRRARRKRKIIVLD